MSKKLGVLNSLIERNFKEMLGFKKSKKRDSNTNEKSYVTIFIYDVPQLF
jgi:hypothetical protein